MASTWMETLTENYGLSPHFAKDNDAIVWLLRLLQTQDISERSNPYLNFNLLACYLLTTESRVWAGHAEQAA